MISTPIILQKVSSDRAYDLVPVGAADLASRDPAYVLDPFCDRVLQSVDHCDDPRVRPHVLHGAFETDDFHHPLVSDCHHDDGMISFRPLAKCLTQQMQPRHRRVAYYDEACGAHAFALAGGGDVDATLQSLSVQRVRFLLFQVMLVQ